MLCNQALCRGAALAKWEAWGGEAEGGGGRSLPAGCHSWEEAELPGGEFLDARLRVLLKIFESSKREGPVGSDPHPCPGGGEGPMLPWVGWRGGMGPGSTSSTF